MEQINRRVFELQKLAITQNKEKESLRMKALKLTEKKALIFNLLDIYVDDFVILTVFS